jgi:predicted nucleic-acid-binding protein
LAVKTLDTNMVVRLLIGDDPQQTPIAEQAFLDATNTGALPVLSFDRRFAASDGVELLRSS